MSISIKEKVKTFLTLIFEPKVVSQFISFRHFGYLLETGWLNSFKSGKPVDYNYKPLPWFTYSAIDFLKEKLTLSLSILEFGGGHSTLFFAERVKKVVSLEHNREWFEKLQLDVSQNVKLISTSADSSLQYLQSLKNLNEKFDLIIVDGLFRNQCLVESLNYINDRGIILLDDSERVDYRDGVTFLLRNEFKQLSFSGIAPGIFFKKCTSFFYKKTNLFNI